MNVLYSSAKHIKVSLWWIADRRHRHRERGGGLMKWGRGFLIKYVGGRNLKFRTKISKKMPLSTHLPHISSNLIFNESPFGPAQCPVFICLLPSTERFVVHLLHFTQIRCAAPKGNIQISPMTHNPLNDSLLYGGTPPGNHAPPFG